MSINRYKSPHKFNRYPFINSLILTDDARFKLSRNLDRIEKGDKSVVMHPALNRLTLDFIVSRWDKIYNSKLEKISNTLRAMELKNRSAIGPRSIAVPWETRSKILENSYSNIDMNGLKVPTVDYSGLPIYPRLRPMSLKQALEGLRSDTSSGLPYLMKKGDVRSTMLSNFKSDFNREYPCVLFTRTQESMKTRNVWGYPSADTLQESRFFKVFSESIEKFLPFRSAIRSPESVDLSISTMIDKALRTNKQILSIDFKAFDDSAKPALVRLAFDYIKLHFQPQYAGEIDAIFNRFTSIGIVTPDGIKSGLHGISSGSPGTNTIGSLVQYCIARLFGIADEDLQVQGDDGVYILDKPEDLEDHFTKFNLQVNKTKGHVSQSEVIYLQNLYSDDYRDGNNICRGIYPTYRALERILFPERFTNYEKYGIDGSEFNSIRTISILENCKYHPLFSELVEFIATVVDRSCLRFNQISLDKYSRQLVKNKVSGGLFNYRLETNAKGINSFDTVKYLMKLRPG